MVLALAILATALVWVTVAAYPRTEERRVRVRVDERARRRDLPPQD